MISTHMAQPKHKLMADPHIQPLNINRNLEINLVLQVGVTNPNQVNLVTAHLGAITKEQHRTLTWTGKVETCKVENLMEPYDKPKPQVPNPKNQLIAKHPTFCSNIASGSNSLELVSPTLFVRATIQNLQKILASLHFCDLQSFFFGLVQTCSGI